MNLNDIKIRNTIEPDDIETVIYLHDCLYKEEYGYGTEFKNYVTDGLMEFYRHYDPADNRVWIAEHNNKIIGFVSLMNRGDAAQLRYFIIIPEYRGIGLGNKLMELFMECLHECGYKKAYLWTTKELNTAGHLYEKFGFKLTEEKPSTAFGKEVIEQRYDLEVI